MSEVNITRPINGISLNGDEFLIDDHKERMVFEDVKTAQEFLLDNGINEEELELFNYPLRLKLSDAVTLTLTPSGELTWPYLIPKAHP